MKRTILSLLSLPFLWFGCNDDKDTIAPFEQEDFNWFVLEDSQDEIDHLRYEIFRATGVPIYYTDTIYKQFRGIDAYGDSIIHYEKLTPYYSITSSTPSYMYYTFSKNRDDIRNAIELLKSDVFPLLIPEMYPRSFLLMESFILDPHLAEGQRRIVGSIYITMSTTLINNIGQLKNLSSTQRDSVKNEVVSTLWYPYLERNNLLTAFYAISTNSTTLSPIYDIYVTPTSNPNYQEWTEYGFLGPRPARVYSQGTGTDGLLHTIYYTPTREVDAVAFIGAVLKMNEADFRNTYNGVPGYDLLLTKYQVMKTIIEKVRP